MSNNQFDAIISAVFCAFFGIVSHLTNGWVSIALTITSIIEFILYFIAYRKAINE